MRILIMQDDFPPDSFGGAGIVAFRLTQELQSRGHEVLVVSATQDKNKEGETVYEGIKVIRFFSKYHERWRAYISLYNPGLLSGVYQILQKFRPDVVHVHNIHTHLSYYSLKLAKKSGAKVFLTAHDVMLFHYGKLIEFIDRNNPSCDVKNYKVSSWKQIKTYKKRYNPLRNIFIKKQLKYVDKIFAVSQATKNALNQNGISNVEVIHNGINLRDWLTPPANLIEEFKKKYKLTDQKVILFGGRLSPLKGSDQLVRAIGEIRRKIPEVILLVAGQGSVIGSQDLMRSTGWISKEELKLAYYASDVVVTPSLYYDPFPTINLEAMACAKPVVTTCFGGGRELVLDKQTGFVVNPYDLQDLSDRLMLLLKNEQLALTMGKRGKQRVEEFFTLEQQVDKIRAYFTE